MSYGEFCKQIAPSVLELQKECSKMSEDEFNEFRKDVMCEVGEQNLSMRFMTAIFDMIYDKLFIKSVVA